MIVWSPSSADDADDSEADPVEPAAGLNEAEATNTDGVGAAPE